MTGKLPLRSAEVWTLSYQLPASAACQKIWLPAIVHGMAAVSEPQQSSSDACNSHSQIYYAFRFSKHLTCAWQQN